MIVVDMDVLLSSSESGVVMSKMVIVGMDEC